jgi:TnpA family transposase
LPTLIALFSHFVPSGVWEAVFIFEGLLQNTSEVIAPKEIHADTQGQSFPAFALATLLRVDQLPRIRNWKDLIVYRPSADTSLSHIESLFGEEVIDWKLIETHWSDLMRVVISIREGRISSSVLLRRPGNESRKNRLFKAFRELGRAVRTIVLLRSTSPSRNSGTASRRSPTAWSPSITSRVAGFGNAGVIGDNDPDHMEKIINFNELLANCVIFHNAVGLTLVLNELSRQEPPRARRRRHHPLAIHHQTHSPIRRLRARPHSTPHSREHSPRSDQQPR